MRKLNRVHDIMVGLLVVIVATGVVHAQVTGFSYVNWDDDLHVVQNRAVTSPGEVPLKDHLLTPYLGYPVPVTVGSYVVDHFVAGLNPVWYHAVNLFIHVLLTVIIFFLAMHLGCTAWLAVACALLFGLHPAAAEPVAWVSGRKDLLAALFSVLALASFMGIPAQDNRARPRLRSGGLALLAALSKPSALLMPVLLLILDLMRPEAPVKHPEKSGGRSFVSRRGPALAVWSAMLGINAALAVIAYRLESGMGALQGASSQYGVLTRVLGAAGWHARIIAWPFDLMPKYLDPAGGPTTAKLAIGGFVIVGVLALTVFAAVRRHPAFVGLALAVLAYAPQSGILPLSRQYANSYVYLMLAGFVLAAAASLAPFAGRAARWMQVAMAVVAVAAVVAFGAASHVQEGVYKDGVTLWANVYKAYPDSPQVCRNLGNAFIYGNRDEPEKAAATYQHCIETLGDRPFFLKNLAVARFRAGQVDQARALFQEYEEIRPGDPVARKYLNMLENK